MPTALSDLLKQIKPFVLSWVGGGTGTVYVYNVCDFGAVGNGVTDDTAAIQAALDATPVGGTVYLPTPVTAYRITSGLTLSKNYQRLVGAPGAAIIFAGSGNAITITGTECVIENMMLSAAGVGDYGIYLNGAYGTVLRKLTIWGMGKNQVRMLNAWDTATYDCVFSALDATGYEAFYHGAESNHVNHYNTRFVAHGGNGACYVAGGSQIGFHGCNFSGDKSAGAFGLKVINCYGLTLHGCYWEWCDGDVILTKSGANVPRMISISGCYFNLNDINSNIGLNVQAVLNLSVRGCLFIGNAPTYTSTAIQVTGTTVDAQYVDLAHDNVFLNLTNQVVDAKGRAASFIDRQMGWNTAVPADGGYWRKGSIVLNSDPSAGERIGWIETTSAAYAVKETWATGRSYTTGDFVIYGTNLYVAASTGTSGATPPTHTTGDASDGGVTWTFLATGVGAATWLGMGQIEHRTGTQNPDTSAGNILPDHVGELYFDSSNLFWYLASHVGGRLWASASVKRGTVTLAAGMATVTFPDTAMTNTAYRIALGGYANETFWISNKGTTGFQINSSNGSSTAVVDWLVTR